MTSKTCPSCRTEKSFDEFGRNAKRADGLAYYCKTCYRAKAKESYRRKLEMQGRKVRAAIPASRPGFRRCPKCSAEKPESEFPRNRSAKSGFGSYCKPCHNQNTRSSIETQYGSSRHYHLKRRYGIGADDVLRLLSEQQGVCPICGCPLTALKAHVDHDHETGAVRGIVCFSCNGGMGQFKDDPGTLRRAAEYLELTRTGNPQQSLPVPQPAASSLPPLDIGPLRALARRNLGASA